MQAAEMTDEHRNRNNKMRNQINRRTIGIKQKN